jgi:uncharacterized membrane protein
VKYLALELWWMPLVAGIPVALLLWAFARRHAGRPRPQWLVLLGLRGGAFLMLLMLLSRPVWVSPESFDEERRRIALLIDRSESMSLDDMDGSRYRAAVRLARDRLVPAFESAGLEVDAYLFAESIRPATGSEIAESAVDGKRTNLAGAVAQAASSGGTPPRAVVVLTDGNATDPEENQRAITALLQRRVPLIGLGFGSDTGPRMLSVEEVLAPTRVPPRQEFRLSVRLQATGSGEFPASELVLLRNGQLHDRKVLTASTEPRIWQETFRVVEELPGRYQYRVQLLLPPDRSVRSPRAESTATVDVTDEDHWRVLFVQGGLTWDFKFIQLAVRSDPALRMSGLSRTASDSRFFQNVEHDELLPGGFPSTLEELAPFRVVVLANLRPSDLRPAQQELLVRFCGETGGGVVMIGGGETFNVAWRDSPLERLLPVRFALGRRRGTVPPFQPQLTPEAVQHPVFQVSGDGDPLSVWRNVPRLTEFAEVEGTKSGAEVWAELPWTSGGRDAIPLIAVQRFGLGRSAAICIPNLWRWRLDKDSQPRHYDRFWQQLFRFMGGGEQDPVTIHLADQNLVTGQDLVATLDLRRLGEQPVPPARFRFQVESLDQQSLSEQAVELGSEQPREVRFRVAEPGTYTLRVVNSAGTLQGTRTVELKDLEIEFALPERNLGALRQWAGISSGIALAAEACRDPTQLLELLQQWDTNQVPQQPRRQPAGIHWSTLLLLLGCLAADWGLRKRWNWT